MFERYTDASRQVVVKAQEVARDLDHGYVGTEHILVALTAAEEQLPAQVLNSFGVTEENTRARLIAIVGIGDHTNQGQIPFTPRAKKILELGLREALSHGHQSIRPGHLLLGLLHEGEGLASRILVDLDASPEGVREQIVERLAEEPDEPVSRARRFKHSLSRIDRPTDLSFVVQPNRQLQRLLMAAAGRALSEERQEFAFADVLAVVRERPDAPQLLDDEA